MTLVLVEQIGIIHTEKDGALSSIQSKPGQLVLNTIENISRDFDIYICFNVQKSYQHQFKFVDTITHNQ